MKVCLLVGIALLVGACSSQGTEVERVHLASLSFDVPAGWQRFDGGEDNGVVSAEWRPAQNERKESILVIRTEAYAAAATKDVDSLVKLLVKSHAIATNVRSPTRHVTPANQEAVQTEFDFTPPNSHVIYHRVHAVLRDNQSIVHVLYTAKDPDPNLVDLKLIVDSLRKEEGQS